MTALLLVFVALLALGALVSLDERVFGPLRLQQPLVAATAAGALVGDARAGLLAGLVLTALWPALVPSGGNLLPSIGLGAVTAGAVAAAGGWVFTDAPGFLGSGRALALAVALAWLVALAGRETEAWLRRRNEERETRAFAALIGQDAALDRAVRRAAIDALLRGWFLVAAATLVAGVVLRAFAGGQSIVDAGGQSVGASRWDLLGHALVLGALGGALVDWAPRLGRVLARVTAAAPATESLLGPLAVVSQGRPRAPQGRLLFLDALYNPRGQQRGGVYRAITPALSAPALEEARQFLATRSFQTHASLSGYVLGPVASAAEARTGEALEVAQALHAPVVSGVGDRLFAGAVHPALAWAGASVGLIALSLLHASAPNPGAVSLTLVAPAAVCVAGAGIAGRYWRGRSWRVGVGGEANVAAELRTRPWARWTRGADWVAALAGAVAYGVVAWNLKEFGGRLEIAFLALGGAAGALAARTGLGPLAQAGLVGGVVLSAAVLVAIGGGGGPWSSGR